MSRSLVVPPQIGENSDSVEILRVFKTSDHQKFISKADVWEDPAAWGILLADLVTHLSEAYALEKGVEPKVARERILHALQMELDFPTA